MASVDPATLAVHDVVEVDLKSVFQGEASVFTPWLARPENLARLADALGLTLEPVATEASTGVFRVDLIARDPTDDGLVIVENQFGRSDHDHLGKALTYLAANGERGARTVVWLAERFADEHRAVLSWLNDNTPEDVSFWGVVPRALRIGGGPPGLRFEIVVRPNAAVKAQRAASGKTVDPSVIETRRLYWPILRAELEKIPDLAGTVIRAGGGRGHCEIYPDKRFLNIPERPYVLAYVNLPISGQHNARVYMRPGRNQVPHWQDRIERIEKHVISECERLSIPHLDGVDFSAVASMTATAREHARRIDVWVRALRDEFAPEAADAGV